AGEKVAAIAPGAQSHSAMGNPSEPGSVAPGDAAKTAAPLESAEGSVIIRKGDSLWRISRRVYGRGVRYSTIYLANQAQISDPHRIWPGQVFKVPGKTPEGENADMSSVETAPQDQSAPR
ncbi:MAG: LysM peptidoglycan-binding domain-containing protein, partial [Brucellaceae bacterium]|nr:LysM peptidoglycan-binding domain-containing protein [Brucellaceae bacterium]